MSSESASRFAVPFLSFEQLREAAAKFLKSHHPSGSIPIPIEEIIDCQFGIDIIPTPGLLHHFEVDAFITSDMESIYVDEYVYLSRPARYRFSLAHEIAHAVLHQKAFRALAFDSIAAWKAVQQKLSDRDHGWLEYHAGVFAGCVLVPPEALLGAWRQARSTADAAGIPIESTDEAGRQIVAAWLARQFEVSREVMRRRLDKEVFRA